MAAKEDNGRLSNKQIATLARVISPSAMDSIATSYMGLTDVKNRSNKEGQGRSRGCKPDHH